MSKTFRDYYDEDNWGTKKIGKTSKQKRQRVKDYLRQVEREGIALEVEDEELELEVDELNG